MQLNGNNYVPRSTRPSVISRVGLEIFFVNNGVYQDPLNISGVSIFAEADRSNIPNDNGLISSSVTPLMHFSNSATDVTDPIFDPSNYANRESTSGIYRLGTGHYIVILDGTINYSGVYNGTTIANNVSAVGNYIDVWNVKRSMGSSYSLVYQDFELFDDTFFNITEPIMLGSKNYLVPKKLKFGSRRDIKVTTELTVQNRNIDQNIVNIFREAAITNPAFEILKINENPELPSLVTVSAFEDTSSMVLTSSENTMIFNWDTETLKTHPQTLNGNMGSLTGAYMIRVKYNLLNEEIISPAMPLILN